MCPSRRGALLALAASLVAAGLSAAGAQAQGVFRIVYNVDRSGSSHVELVGNVYNDASVDALDVRLSAEALDAGGRVLARGVVYAAPVIPARGGAVFVARLPAAPGINGFRVSVISSRYRYNESP